MQPINYLLENKNPVDMLMGGVQQWQNMKNNDYALARTADENRLLKAQHDNEIQGMTDLQGLDFNNPDHVRQYAARYPTLSKGVNDYLGKLDNRERQSMLADTSKAISLLRNGDNVNAAQMARAKAAAYKNAGNSTTAAEYEQIASMMKTHPTAALQSLQMSYALSAGKDSMAGYKDYMEANTPKVKDINAGGETGAYITDPVTGEVKYQKLVNNSISPDKQLDADTSMYASDNSLTGTKYSADSSRQASMYSSDNSLKGSMYSAYVGYQGKVLDNAHQDARSEAQLKMDAMKLEYQRQQDEIKNKQGEYKSFGGKVYVVYKDGSARPAMDVNGQQILDNTGTNGKASPQQEEGQRIQRVGTVLDEIEKILPKATGSMVGTGVDKAAGLFGIATEGATTTAQLQSLSGQLVALMPKMSGPQSDKDVLMYKQMAGQLDDPTKPIAQRLAALKTIRALNNKYAAMNNSGAASGQTTQTAAPSIHDFFTGN